MFLKSGKTIFFFGNVVDLNLDPESRILAQFGSGFGVMFIYIERRKKIIILEKTIL